MCMVSLEKCKKCEKWQNQRHTKSIGQLVTYPLGILLFLLLRQYLNTISRWDFFQKKKITWKSNTSLINLVRGRANGLLLITRARFVTFAKGVCVKDCNIQMSWKGCRNRWQWWRVGQMRRDKWRIVGSLRWSMEDWAVGLGVSWMGVFRTWFSSYFLWRQAKGKEVSKKWWKGRKIMTLSHNIYCN